MIPLADERWLARYVTQMHITLWDGSKAAEHMKKGLDSTLFTMWSSDMSERPLPSRKGLRSGGLSYGHAVLRVRWTV